ncbi:sulfurtransferase complex subunit TusD [Alteromonas sp. a30]|uniref:sulfurtransferase complex subunit TusD n=1 Tax=Alteromonas sp. a30 TaxID=2730917 RepID=UPI0022807E0E|nr:sulfurtransferase complex subunit TusD [Alteromonas sp. a30]MCY7295119.1 sulfurtransferase complex subunit TusD [Alteromonas sp. a30]
MANFVLLVTSPHYDSNSANAVKQFTLAALDAGHNVTVFFYNAGVTHANKFNLPQAGEPSSSDIWQHLYDKQVPLLVCATAAGRRGIIDDIEAKQHHLKESSLHPVFSLSGLTELAALSSQADRMVQF